MRVPGRALGCLPDNVGEARWLQACRTLVGVVDAGLLGGGWLRARQCARVTLSPNDWPQVCQIGFGHVSLARARASVHEAIRPFRPWPCEPFP